MKKVIYTVLYGDYDKVHEPTRKTPGWDYVLITGNEKLKSRAWDVMYHPSNLSDFLASREPKIKHNMLFSNYDISIYVDASIEVNTDLDGFVSDRLSSSADMSVSQHPARHCVYDELTACIRHMRLTKKKSDQIRESFLKDNIPEGTGLVQCDILIRRHDRPFLDRFNDLWFEKTKFTTRDQLSFMYVYQKHRIISFNLFSAYEASQLMYKHRHINGL